MRRLLAIITGFFLLAAPALADTVIDNPLNSTAAGNITTIPQAIGLFVRFIIGFVGSGALVMFVWGGFRMILARGQEKEIAEAKKIMTWATYGLIVIFFSYAIVTNVVGALNSAGTTS